MRFVNAVEVGAAGGGEGGVEAAIEINRGQFVKIAPCGERVGVEEEKGGEAKGGAYLASRACSNIQFDPVT